MVTINKSILKSIFLIGALLAFNCQQAMEKKKKKKENMVEKRLRIIAKIKPGLEVKISNPPPEEVALHNPHRGLLPA